MLHRICLLFWRARVLLFYFVVTILCIIVTLSLIISGFFTYKIAYKFCKWFSFAYIWSARTICALKYEIVGKEKLPKYPCIVLSNHQSFWENIFMQILIPKHSWVIKQEIYNIPVVGPAFVKFLDPISVNRNDPTSLQRIIEKGKQKIKQGLWIVMFPEGTRVPVNKRIRIRPSGVKLASICKVPIVIVAHNAGLCWPPTSFWIKKSGKITVEIVDVIHPQDVEGMDIRDLNKKVEAIIHESKDRVAKYDT